MAMSIFALRLKKLSVLKKLNGLVTEKIKSNQEAIREVVLRKD